MKVFINNAIADAKDISHHENSYSLLIMLLIFFLIFYFMIFRPQQKKTKDHKKLLDSISKGDEIQTTTGLIGKIVKISATGYVTLAINDNTEIIINRDFISNVLPKGTIKSL